MARTRTSLFWLLELLPAVLGDSRVQLLFTVDEDDPSAFGEGLAGLITSTGALLVPWAHASRTRFDLIVAAHESGRLGSLRGPMLVLPHGPGYTRDLTASGLPRTAVALAASRTDVTVAAVPSEEAARVVHPAARVVVTGDPCFDGLLAARPESDGYRHALGLHDGQRLITVTSTWGRHSLFARRPTLARELLAALPSGENRVALVLHPNVWVGHGEWQLRVWLRDELAAGLVLVPWDAGWRQAVLASDLVVGDHGSVGLYAAAIGVPFALAVHENDELVPGSALGRLVDSARRLDTSGGLKTAVDAIIADGTDAVAREARSAFSHEDEALTRLRAAAYDLLGLAVPHDEVARAVPAPLALSAARPASMVAELSVDADAGVAIRLIPATVAPHPRGDRERFVISTSAETDRRITDAAAVLIESRPAASPAAAELRARTLLQRHPGARCAAVVVPDGVLVWWRDGEGIVVTAPAAADSAAAAAFARYLMTGDVPRAVRMRVTIDGRETAFASTPYG
ncbi:hypothetical protein QT381_15095 [Galbitalea sp. SE-J8]|uniref:hypothetical protein n=1 Tax=Galbitalea sp. SE-J8 TaxID=3054952 RepID=UPI00259CD044|nr:hypothetical protein [Galbitalea sp. SE-J8]MDM4764330.1 hypothetical protein [Galbitalea sp. SE-J8]